jgi:hypothetical protein
MKISPYLSSLLSLFAILFTLYWMFCLSLLCFFIIAKLSIVESISFKYFYISALFLSSYFAHPNDFDIILLSIDVIFLGWFWTAQKWIIYDNFLKSELTFEKSITFWGISLYYKFFGKSFNSSLYYNLVLLLTSITSV